MVCGMNRGFLAKLGGRGNVVEIEREPPTRGDFQALKALGLLSTDWLPRYPLNSTSFAFGAEEAPTTGTALETGVCNRECHLLATAYLETACSLWSPANILKSKVHFHNAVYERF